MVYSRRVKFKLVFALFILVVVLGIGYAVYTGMGGEINKKYVIFKKSCLMSGKEYKPGSSEIIRLDHGCAVCSCISGPAFSCFKADKCPD